MECIKRLTNTIVEDIDTVWEVMLGYVGDVSSFVNGICGIAALLYIGSKVWASYAKGESLDIYSLLRPFVIGILCVSFTTIVVPGIRFLCDPVCNYFDAMAEKSNQMVDGVDYLQAAKDAKAKCEKAMEDAKKKENADKSWWQPKAGGVFDKIGFFFSHFWRYFKTGAFYVFGWIFDLLGTLMMCLTKIILVFTRTFSLSVMVMLGPIVFAGSMFPGFKDGLKQWIARFVCIYMWMPFFSLADIFINVINNLIGKNMFESLQAKTTQLNSYSDYHQLMFELMNFQGNMYVISGLVCLVAVALYKAVPTLASWIIAGGDASGNLGSVADLAAHAGAMAAAAPAGLGGGGHGAEPAVGKAAAQMAGGGGAVGRSMASGGASGGGGATGGLSGGGGASGAAGGLSGGGAGGGGAASGGAGGAAGGGGLLSNAGGKIAKAGAGGLGRAIATGTGASSGGGGAAGGLSGGGASGGDGGSSSGGASPIRMSDGGGESPGSAESEGSAGSGDTQGTSEPHLSRGMKFRRGMHRWNNASRMRHGDEDDRAQVASSTMASNGILRMAVGDKNRDVQMAAVRNPYVSNRTLKRAIRKGYQETANAAMQELLRRGEQIR